MSGLILVLVLLLMGLQVFMVGRVVARAVAVSRQLRDPQQLRQLLSGETRAALEEAGIDPSQVSIQEIQADPELRKRLAADLRRELGQKLLGGKRLRGLVSAWSQDDRPRVPSATAMPSLPPPIDQSDRSGLRVGIALACLAVAAGALLMLLGRA